MVIHLYALVESGIDYQRLGVFISLDLLGRHKNEVSGKADAIHCCVQVTL